MLSRPARSWLGAEAMQDRSWLGAEAASARSWLGAEARPFPRLPADLGGGEDEEYGGILPRRSLPGRDLYRWAPFGAVPPVPGVDTGQDLAPFEADPEPDRPPPARAEAPREQPSRAKLEPETREAQAEPAQEPKRRRREKLPDVRHTVRQVIYDLPGAGDSDGEAEGSARGGSLFTPAEARQNARRLGRSVYDALQTQGHFGLVDGGETLAGGVRRVVVHVPKRNRGYALDLRPGEVIYANSARGRGVRGRLDVLYVSRHKYVPPGHAVTSCVIGVSEAQWERFLQ